MLYFLSVKNLVGFYGLIIFNFTGEAVKKIQQMLGDIL